MPMKTTARLFKALSDENRLRILALLGKGELCVCDLMAVLDLPQSTVSRHLAYLRNVGLVEDQRHGIWMFYRLADDMTPFEHDLREMLTARLAELPQIRNDLKQLANLEASGDKTLCR